MNVFTLTSPGRKYALDDDHVVAIRAWMAENLAQPCHADPIHPGSVGFQAGGVVRIDDDAAAFVFRVKWSEFITAAKASPQASRVTHVDEAGHGCGDIGHGCDDVSQGCDEPSQGEEKTGCAGHGRTSVMTS